MKVANLVSGVVILSALLVMPGCGRAPASDRIEYAALFLLHGQASQEDQVKVQPLLDDYIHRNPDWKSRPIRLLQRGEVFNPVQIQNGWVIEFNAKAGDELVALMEGAFSKTHRTEFLLGAVGYRDGRIYIAEDTVVTDDGHLLKFTNDKWKSVDSAVSTYKSIRPKEPKRKHPLDDVKEVETPLAINLPPDTAANKSPSIEQEMQLPPVFQNRTNAVPRRSHVKPMQKPDKLETNIDFLVPIQ